MTHGHDIERIRDGLRSNMRSLAEQLFPNGRYEAGGRYWPVNHVRGDRKPGSMVIDTQGPTAGRFVDFADQDQVKGDALALIAYAHHGSAHDKAALGRAIKWAADWLGISGDKPAAIAPRTPPAARLEPVDDAAEREAKARKALGWWLKGEALKGTIGETYLRNRGIALDALGFVPGAIKFHPALQFQRDPEIRLPGLLTAMTNGDGKVRAVHRTFLDPSPGRKARAKRMWGDVGGASIRLSKGENKCSPEDAARQGLWGETLAIGEGIEDMLTWSLLYPAHRTAAFGALSLLARCPVYPSVDRVVIVRDNDENPSVRKAFERQACAFMAAHADIDVEIHETVGVKDVNELWAVA